MIPKWFKTKARFRSCHQLLLKLSRARGKEVKNMISGHLFCIFKFSKLLKI